MDIVEWLRNSTSTEWNGEMMNKIADEIERLEAVVARYEERGHCPSCDGDHL